MPHTDFEHPYANVLGVRVSAVNLDGAVALADRWIIAGKPGYICVTGVHGIMEAQYDAGFRRVLNGSVVNTPDGMPMTWVGWLQGFREMDRVFGPDFMAAVCRLSVERGYRNFFLGGKPGVAQLLAERLKATYPGLVIAGTFTPPFGTLSSLDEEAILNAVQSSRSHIVWVGLGSPRQEWFMARWIDRFHVPLLVGVGAAFDFHTGALRDSPHWVKRSGLQWIHRLMQEPKRLWPRYLRNNPAFIWRIACQFAGLRDRPSDFESESRGAL
jgi:N-acetylglucosaminyldiphosphoundecaprenol N-acetyl-beta-D-mannosaminyltransferase